MHEVQYNQVIMRVVKSGAKLRFSAYSKTLQEGTQFSVLRHQASGISGGRHMTDANNQPLTHLDAQGRAHMVDVGAKPPTQREALARGRVILQPTTLALIMDGTLPKGDVLAVARVAGIMAAKRTPELIPLCHTLLLTHTSVQITPDPAGNALEIEAKVRTTGQTGVEIEALTAVSVAALTIYDMCKAVDRGMRISDIRLVEKRGGASGEWLAEGEPERQ
jgi:cyclic pyranopterin monophosphate synthase